MIMKIIIYMIVKKSIDADVDNIDDDDTDNDVNGIISDMIIMKMIIPIMKSSDNIDAC